MSDKEDFNEGLIPLDQMSVQDLQIEIHVLEEDLTNPDFTALEKSWIRERIKETRIELATR